MPTMQPIHYRGVACYSFRQLDETAGTVKGTAFRRFKQAEPSLSEGMDYFYLDAEREQAFIEALRAQGAIYRSTLHLVLITERGRERLYGQSGTRL